MCAQPQALPSAYERRAEKKRAAICRAAQDTFLAQGFELATMDAIAAEAQVSKQTLYRYFPSKEELYVAVLQALTVHSFRQDVPEVLNLASVTSRADVEELLTRIAQSILGRLMEPEYLALLRTLIAEAPRFPSLAAQFRAAVIVEGQQTLADILQQAEHTGLLTRANPVLVARLLVGALLTYVFADGLLMPGDHPDVPDEATTLALVQFVLRALPWE